MEKRTLAILAKRYFETKVLALLAKRYGEV
jgi:hypothetical protein